MDPDYTRDDETPRLRKPLLKLAVDSPINSRAPDTDTDEGWASFPEDGIAIAKTTDEDETDSTRYPNSESEAVFNDEQAALHETFSPVHDAPVALPPDIGHGKSAFSPSVTSVNSRISHDAQSNNTMTSSRNKMPEFFSSAVFQTVLHDPTIAHQLLKFSQTRLCGESIEFLTKVNKYHALLSEVSKAIYEIHKEFISNSAPAQINLSEKLKIKLKSDMKTALSSTLPNLESVFADAQDDTERLVYTDIYPKFVRQQMTMSAARALAGDRAKYAGLGDCFVLTDPSKADNPIIYASDGFVKVTGYQRTEIIPRNCRFLQSRQTDPAAVKRLKSAIDNREESVELLLNHKKNGEPFWNLLYTAPLFDERGNVIFFLGGQINCSTTIHNARDVLRILAQAPDTDEEHASATMSPLRTAPPSKSRILSAFRTKTKTSSTQQGPPGMENALLDRIGDKDFKSQMDAFYTAYSNFIVLNYSSYLISFVSSGITDLLFPIKAETAFDAQAVGADIFKFLANHGSGSVSRDFKSSIKRALKMGQAISLNMKLCARPYMGLEEFVVHWTPLKDEAGRVTWVVITLASGARA